MKNRLEHAVPARQTVDAATRQSIDAVVRQFFKDETTTILMESFAEAFLVINEQSTVMLVNRRFSELFGYEKNEIIGQQLDLIIPGRFRAAHKEHARNYFKAPHVRPMGRGLELKGLKKDGSEFPVEVSISFVQSDREKLGMAFVTDITARAEAERALQNQNRALSDFAQTVAHDLKSLISAITGFSELLEEEYENLSVKERQISLNKVKETGYKMDDIINELLFLARARREDVVLRKIDLKIAVQEALQRLQWKIDATGAKIVVGELDKNLLGHQPWIEEVIYNLLSNALSHGGKGLTVRIATELSAGKMSRVRITDNGDGMSEDQLRVLLEQPEELPYNWVKGHGLGLSIVHHVLEKLGSSLQINCVENEGCCFSFLLPTGSLQAGHERE
jgi:PAS domain S-box-containing protein